MNAVCLFQMINECKKFYTLYNDLNFTEIKIDDFILPINIKSLDLYISENLNYIVGENITKQYDHLSIIGLSKDESSINLATSVALTFHFNNVTIPRAYSSITYSRNYYVYNSSIYSYETNGLLRNDIIRIFDNYSLENLNTFHYTYAYITFENSLPNFTSKGVGSLPINLDNVPKKRPDGDQLQIHNLIGWNRDLQTALRLIDRNKLSS